MSQSLSFCPITSSTGNTISEEDEKRGKETKGRRRPLTSYSSPAFYSQEKISESIWGRGTEKVLQDMHIRPMRKINDKPKLKIGMETGAKEEKSDWVD